MRILHTSDWHLGRNFHGAHLLDAQVGAIEAMIDMVRSESIDVVVIAGDIYDRAVPGADTVTVLSEALSGLRAAGASVVGISGNHDSAQRIGFAEPVLAAGGVTLRGDVTLAGQPVLVPERDGGSAVAFYPIPYLEPETARHALAVPDARSHERLLRVALDRARADLAQRAGVRSVAVVHAFVTGGQGCDSELALAVGGSAEVPLKSLSGFDYVALGHLHGRQRLGDGRARYAGSPVAYSFSERAQTKGVWIVDLPPSGDMHATAIDLPVQRRLFELRGELEGLLTDPSLRDAERGFVHAVLTDALLPAEAMPRLRRRFEHAVLLTHQPPAAAGRTGLYTERVKGRTDLELTLDFVEHVAGRKADADETHDLIAAIEPSVPADDRAA